jgi:hypothetical protein
MPGPLWRSRDPMLSQCSEKSRPSAGAVGASRRARGARMRSVDDVGDDRGHRLERDRRNPVDDLVVVGLEHVDLRVGGGKERRRTEQRRRHDGQALRTRTCHVAHARCARAHVSMRRCAAAAAGRRHVSMRRCAAAACWATTMAEAAAGRASQHMPPSTWHTERAETTQRERSGNAAGATRERRGSDAGATRDVGAQRERRVRRANCRVVRHRGWDPRRARTAWHRRADCRRCACRRWWVGWRRWQVRRRRGWKRHHQVQARARVPLHQWWGGWRRWWMGWREWTAGWRQCKGR